MFRKLKGAIDHRLRNRFVRLQGEGVAHQADVYRCNNCRRLITWNVIREGRACCQRMMRPTEPTFQERIKLLLWKV